MCWLPAALSNHLSEGETSGVSSKARSLQYRKCLHWPEFRAIRNSMSSGCLCQGAWGDVSGRWGSRGVSVPMGSSQPAHLRLKHKVLARSGWQPWGHRQHAG